MIEINRVAMPVYGALALVAAGLLPAWRLHRQTGAWGFAAHRQPSGRWIAGGLVALAAALAAWVALYAASVGRFLPGIGRIRASL